LPFNFKNIDIKQEIISWHPSCLLPVTMKGTGI
jgi:hypothetical protein